MGTFKRLFSSCVLLFLLSPVLAQQDEWSNIERIVAVGDIHGDYDNYLEVLGAAGIINAKGNWDAGETHFVQTGDVPDRGPDTDKIIKHLQKLEGQARRQGGKVHALIGNHEMMNMLGDLRYVSHEEYDALTDRRSEKRQEDYYERVVAYRLDQQEQNPDQAAEIFNEAYRESWEEGFPLGYVEHRTTWAPNGDFGEWVLEHNTMVKINNVLFLHGGIGPQMPEMTLRQVNDAMRDELEAKKVPELRLSEMDDGPLWYRGLASNDPSLEQENLERVLGLYDVDHIVIGHTPGLGTISPRFNGRVILIDTGISDYYGAHLASLLIEGETFSAIQGNKTTEIPMDKAGLSAYYDTIMSLGTPTSALQTLVNELKNNNE